MPWAGPVNVSSAHRCPTCCQFCCLLCQTFHLHCLTHLFRGGGAEGLQNPESASAFPSVPLTAYKGQRRGLWHKCLPAADTSWSKYNLFAVVLVHTAERRSHALFAFLWFYSHYSTFSFQISSRIRMNKPKIVRPEVRYVLPVSLCELRKVTSTSAWAFCCHISE